MSNEAGKAIFNFLYCHKVELSELEKLEKLTNLEEENYYVCLYRANSSYQYHRGKIKNFSINLTEDKEHKYVMFSTDSDDVDLVDCKCLDYGTKWFIYKDEEF